MIMNGLLPLSNLVVSAFLLIVCVAYGVWALTAVMLVVLGLNIKLFFDRVVRKGSHGTFQKTIRQKAKN